MGITYVDMEVANPADPSRTEAVQFLVDSGATFSVVPRPILSRLGILPHTEQAFRLANGERITRQKGTALFKYRGRTGGSDVIFGEENDSRLLGVFTLEALGFALDPLRRELLDIPMMLAEDTITEL